MIFIIKVTTNKEEKAIDMISERIEKKELNVFSVAKPHGLRGYILLEAEDRESAEEAVFNLPYIKGIIGKTITYEEIKNMIEPTITSISIKDGDIVEMIAERIEKKELNVFSVTKPHGLRGYILLEAEDRESAEEAVFNLPYIKGIIGKTITYEEIKNMIEPTITSISIKDGDIVEMIGQTFKGEKAKVLRIDKQKEEVVISLLGALVQFPVTVKLDNIKVIRREEGEDEDE